MGVAKEGEQNLAETCDVCGEPLDEENVSRCLICGRRFHMAWSTDAPVENCGHAFFDERSSALGFICSPCVDENREIGRSLVDTGQMPV